MWDVKRFIVTGAASIQVSFTLTMWDVKTPPNKIKPVVSPVLP